MAVGLCAAGRHALCLCLSKVTGVALGLNSYESRRKRTVLFFLCPLLWFGGDGVVLGSLRVISGSCVAKMVLFWILALLLGLVLVDVSGCN